MSRALIVLHGVADRARAIKLIGQVPTGTRVEFKGARRSLPQNDKLWASLSDVAAQKEHCGRRYTPDQWKVLFMHACGAEVQFLSSLDGATFIPWGNRSSDLSKAEMGELIEFVLSWGAQNGVIFHDTEAPTLSHAEPLEEREDA